MKAWLIYDHERASVNSWLIKHYLGRAPHFGMEIELVMVEDLRASMPSELPFVAIMRCIDIDIHRKLEAQGVRVFNSSEVSAITNNKATTYEFARSIGVPVLPYHLIPAGGDMPTNLSFPCVVKPVDGHGGAGVQMVESASELVLYLTEQSSDVLTQEVASDAGRDVRVYILGNRVLAAVERRAPAGTLRANFTLGGSAQLVELSAEMRSHVEAICSALPLDFAGIDFLFHHGSPVLGEIEDVVGARMLYELTDIDVVDEYLAYIADAMR